MRVTREAFLPRANERKAVRRVRGGTWLRELRKTCSLSQVELANKIGIKYYTFISQLENGARKVPPGLYERYAKAVGVPTEDFAKRALYYWEPATYAALFEPDPSDPIMGEGQ